MRPQKDHVVSQGKQGLINRDIDASKQLTVIQETGKATGNDPPKPHTQATFHDQQADVKEINRLRGLKPGEWKSFEEEIITPSRNSRYRSGFDEFATNKALLDEVGSMFEVDQPNRSEGASSAPLDWTKEATWTGPAVDPATGKVIPAEVAASQSLAAKKVTPVAAEDTAKNIGPAKLPSAPESAAGETGALARIAKSPVTGLVATQLAKQLTQPIAERIVDSVANSAVNSIVKDIGGAPMSEEETAGLATGHRAAVSALLGQLPPGIDIGVALISGGIAYGFSETAFKPVMLEYSRQFPTVADFFNKVYGGY